MKKENTIPVWLKNPRQDTIFKAMFCQNTVESRLALKSFLESIIGKKIDSIQMRPNEFALLLEGEKNPILDLSVTFNDSEQASIEMQAYIPDYDYKNRALYYLLKQASSTLKQGDSYDELYTTYQISVLDFHYLKPDKAIHWVKLCEIPEKELPEKISKISKDSFSTPDYYRRFSDKLNIIFVELPDAKGLLNKDVKSLSDLEKWYIFLLYADKEDKQNLISQISQNTEGIKMAEAALNNISMDYWDRLAEISREKWDHDRLSNQLAREKKMKEQFEKATNIAREQAMQQGLQQGIQQGSVQANIKTAMHLLKLGKLSIEDIAISTELSKEEILKFQKNLSKD